MRWYALILAALMLPASVAPICRAEITVQSLKDAIKAMQVARRDGNHTEAVRIAADTVEELRESRTFGPSHIFTGVFLGELGVSCMTTGLFERSESSLRESLNIFLTAKGRETIDSAVVRNRLGRLYWKLKRYSDSDKQFTRCLRFLKQTGKRRELQASVVNNLGYLHIEMGQFEQAEKSFLEAAGIAKQLRKDLLRSTVLNNLGQLYNRWARKDGPQLAIAALETARDLQRNTAAGQSSALVAKTRNNLGAAYYRRFVANGVNGDRDTAEQHIKAAIAVAKTRKLERSLVEYQSNLACLHRAAGKYDESQRLFETCIKTLQGSHRSAFLDLSVARLQLARLHCLTGNLDDAATEADGARRLLRRHAMSILSLQTESEQATFLKNKEQLWFHTALTVGLIGRSKDSVARKSAEWLLNGKALTAQVLSDRYLLVRSRVAPEARGLIDELAKVRSQLAASARIVGSTMDETLLAKEAKLSRRLARETGLLSDPSWTDLATVQRVLPKDAMLIEIARIKKIDFQHKSADWVPLAEHYIAWIVPPVGDDKIRIVDLGPAARVDRAVGELHRELEAAPDKRGPGKVVEGTINKLGELPSEERMRRPLRKLSALVLQPLLPHIDKAKRWIISPDSQLWRVPWSALLLGKQYVVEKKTISYVVSGRDLIARPKRKPAPPVVFAGIDYGNPVRLFVKLKFSGLEGQAVVPYLKEYTKSEVKLLTGNRAREQAFHKLSNPRVVLLSTHAFFLGGSQAGEGRSVAADAKRQLFDCGIAFADANKRAAKGSTGARDDGVLFGKEVLSCDLRGTELVYLSACQTALGQQPIAGEGVKSLQHAFQLAGARSVVGTLWEVPDRDTALLTIAFFKKLASGGDKAEALRAAQLARIQSRRDASGAAHPYFWAGLVLNGNWKSAE